MYKVRKEGICTVIYRSGREWIRMVLVVSFSRSFVSVSCLVIGLGIAVGKG